MSQLVVRSYQSLGEMSMHWVAAGAQRPSEYESGMNQNIFIRLIREFGLYQHHDGSVSRPMNRMRLVRRSRMRKRNG